MDLAAALGEAHYCIWCHEQGKDSCARGLPEKKPADGIAAGDPVPQAVPFGVTLAGCPLEEKISEFHKLRAEGWPIAALADHLRRQSAGRGAPATGSATTA